MTPRAVATQIWLARALCVTHATISRDRRVLCLSYRRRREQAQRQQFPT